MSEEKKSGKTPKVVKAGPFVSLPKIALLLCIIGAVVLFNILFKNMLIEHALEGALSSAFNAKADVRGLDFDILGARLVIGHCEVANARQPMRNLFELDGIDIDIDFNRLLRGKVILDNVQCNRIGWDTPRKFSGALGRGEGKKTDEQPHASPVAEAGNIFTDLVKGINAEELLNREMASLKSPQLFQTTSTTLTEIETRVQTDVKEFEKKVTALDNDMQKIQAMDFKTVKDPLSAQRYLETIQKTSQSVTEVVNSGNYIGKSLTAEMQKISEIDKALTNAIALDKEYLFSLVDIKNGKAINIASEAIQEYLRSRLGTLYSYAVIALGAAQQLKSSGPQQADVLRKPPEIKRSKGVFVSFPVKEYPEFLLKHLGASAKSNDETVVFALDVRDITNNPVIWPRPVSFFTFATFEGKSVQVTGSVDLRKDAKQLLTGKSELTNFDFKAGAALSFIDLSDITGVADLVINFSIDAQNNFSGRCDIVFHRLHAHLTKSDSLIGKLVQDVFTGHENLTAQLIFSVSEKGQFVLQTATNIDRLIAEQLDKVFASLAKSARRQLEQAFMKRTENELAGHNSLQAGINASASDAEQHRAQLDNWQKQLDQKEKDLKKKISDLGKKLVPVTEKKVPGLPGF